MGKYGFASYRAWLPCFSSLHIENNPAKSLSRSLTKSPTLTESQAQAICIKFHGSPQTIQTLTELTNGCFSTICLVILQSGWEGIVKIGPPQGIKVLQYEHDILSVEATILRLIKSKTSVPVPEVYQHDTSLSITKSPFILMERARGVSLNHLRMTMSQENRQAVDIQVGKYLREINGIEGRYFGLVSEEGKKIDSWRQALMGIFESIIKDGQSMKVTLPYDEIQGHLIRMAGLLDDVKTPRLLWWDGWDGNVLVDETTKEVTALIDFERALWGDPLMETSFLRPRNGVIEGYGENLCKTRRDEGRRLLYTLHFCLVAIVEISYRKVGGDMETHKRRLLEETLEGLGKWEESSE